MSKQQPRPRSNFIQILLIGAIIFLGYNFIFGKGGREQLKTEELQTRYSEATDAGKPDEVLKHGQPYAKRLRSEDRADDARQVEYYLATITLEKARTNRDYNLAATAMRQFEKISREAPESDISRQAASMVQEANDEGAQLAKYGGSGTFSGFIQFGYVIVDTLVRFTGSVPWFSYWFAALLLAFIVRGLAWPLSAKQIRGFKRMSLLQPMIKELQAKYQGQELQSRTMKLYKKYNINPMAGCWPMLVQMPFFIWLFWSMRAYQFEFQKGTFLWVNPDMAASFPGIIAPNLGEQDVPLILLYGISMIATTALSVTDPATARQSRIIGLVMAVVITVMMFFWHLPSAFILYWLGFNVMSTAQSMMINRQPIPPLVEVDPSQQKKNGLFSGLIPTNGPKRSAEPPKVERKTGAPVLHKPKGGKKRKKRKK
ncbi:MAG: membrane protein insertase YidC [Armatimonadetes bacterium]|nr:membrane protein insertase YidC [Armatimonadota bacterium]